MLKYLLEKWTDFWSVYWFELSVSRTLIPVNGVLFLSAVFEKLARTHTPIFDYLVSGVIHVPTYEMMKMIEFECVNRLVELHL